MTKNLEKLAEIGEKKLFNDLNLNLIGLKQSLMDIQRKGNPDDPQKEYLNEKIKIYRHLIATCKNCGLDVTEDEEIYTKIIKDANKYLGEIK